MLLPFLGSSHFSRPGLLHCSRLSCTFSSRFPYGVFCGFLPSFGFSICGFSLPLPCGTFYLGSFGLSSSVLGCGPFRSALFPCVSAPSSLFSFWLFLPFLVSSSSLLVLLLLLLFLSTLHFLSIFWCLRSLPLPFSSSSFLVSRVLCSGVLLLLHMCARVRCPSCGVFSLVFVCLAFVLSACYPGPPSFGVVWIWCLFCFPLWSLLW